MTNFPPSPYQQPAFLQNLQRFEMGGKPGATVKMKKRDLIFVLRNVSILIENGLSLPKAFETLVREKSLKRYASMLQTIKSRVESGDAFSEALTQFPATFTELMVSQIRLGERSGTIPQTLSRLMLQLEHADNLKSLIIKKLTYPALLCTAGSGAVTFMLLYVVPTFENVYKESGAQLPAVTQFLIEVGHFGTNYGALIASGIVGFLFGIAYTRRNPAGRLWMDTWLLSLPVVGPFFKNIAVLQFVEVLGNLMDAGFTVVEALKSCSTAVGNRCVRGKIL
ncbi:MAG: type II secretion system F family protein, partial [Pirellulaceae bacterium]